MNRKNHYPLIFISIILIQFGCAGSKLGSQKKEKVAIHVFKKDVVYAALQNLDKQDKPQSLALRSRGSRGILDTYGGGVISFGVEAVRQVIANNAKKYTDSWTQGLDDLYFYDQPSTEGPFDPVGLQFSGFNVTRSVRIDKNVYTALTADFEVNTDSLACKQILNDGVFRLKLKDIQINYVKAKMPVGKDYINLDLEIVFTSSYVTKEGQFYTDVPLGRFFYAIRHAPVDSTKAGYKEFYDNLKNTPLTGKSFIVPRSFGFYKTEASNINNYYNQGNFSIVVKVTESSRNNFRELLMNSSGIAINYGSGVIMRGLQAAGKKKN